MHICPQGYYDNFNFKIANSPDVAGNAYEAYSSVFADFHPEQDDVEWRINRRDAAAHAQGQEASYVYDLEGSGDYDGDTYVDYEKASAPICRQRRLFLVWFSLPLITFRLCTANAKHSIVAFQDVYEDDEDYFFNYGEDGSGYDPEVAAATINTDSTSSVYYARIVFTLRRPWSAELNDIQGRSLFAISWSSRMKCLFSLCL